MYFALCQNLKLLLVNLHMKTLKTELKRFSELIALNTSNLSKI